MGDIYFLRIVYTLEILNSPLHIPGSEIYQETLAKALAKHFSVTLLIVDSLLLPGVSFTQVLLNIFLSVCLPFG